VQVNSLKCNYFPKHPRTGRLPSLLRDKSMTHKIGFPRMNEAMMFKELHPDSSDYHFQPHESLAQGREQRKETVKRMCT